MSERVKPLDKYERAALDYLSSCGGGFTAGHLARECGCGSSRSQMAIFRTWTIKSLYERGLIDRIDTETPHVYVITNDGRAAISKARGTAKPGAEE